LTESLAANEVLVTNLVREGIANRSLRYRLHRVETHNQWFERCESAWCNPSFDKDPALVYTPENSVERRLTDEFEASRKGSLNDQD
jgi:hypothetical protein